MGHAIDGDVGGGRTGFGPAAGRAGVPVCPLQTGHRGRPGYTRRPAHGPAQVSSFAFACWNSASDSAPLSFSATSLVSSSACDPPAEDDPAVWRM